MYRELSTLLIFFFLLICSLFFLVIPITYSLYSDMRTLLGISMKDGVCCSALISAVRLHRGFSIISLFIALRFPITGIRIMSLGLNGKTA